jgi:hypothetical protein
MDLSKENLPNLKSTIEERYPDVTVRHRLHPIPSHCSVDDLAGHPPPSRRR